MADYPHLEITPEIRAALDAIPQVRVHIYSHPDWDSKLILKAESETETDLDRAIAEDYMGEDDDRALLTLETDWMNKADFDNLTEFDG